ncbi:hypothetical protein VTN49DRAFT_353 [Thermomyces lanuginosus]|uniref:uncharacterized protein n=1 Tax=Thermomyces lanuginosus TaxID=5541 RepID=UPI003743D1F7
MGFVYFRPLGGRTCPGLLSDEVTERRFIDRPGRRPVVLQSGYDGKRRLYEMKLYQHYLSSFFVQPSSVQLQ